MAHVNEQKNDRSRYSHRASDTYKRVSLHRQCYQHMSNLITMRTASDTGYEQETAKVTCPKCEHEFDVQIRAEVEVIANITNVSLEQ